MRTRRASLKDMPGLLKIEAECFESEKFNEETVRAFVVRDDCFVLVTTEVKDIIGSAMCIVSQVHREGKIASIAVVRRYRGTGVGSDLLESCEREFEHRDLAKYSLEVDMGNAPAIAMYTSHGYEIAGVIRDFYGPGRNAYSMEKTIGLRKTRVIVRSS